MSGKKVKLGEICDFINGGAWSDKEYVSYGIPVLKVSNFKPNGFSVNDINYLPVESAEKYRKNELKLDDVIIATVGSHPTLKDSAAGRSCVINSRIVGFYLNQNAVCLRTKNKNILNQRYLGFLVKTPSFLHYIQSSGRGAANQMRIAIGTIKEYEFVLPQIEIQGRIADILSAYDDLIENNQKQIKLLEEAAQRLYKEWFVDLHFPGYEHTKIVDGVPEGWIKRNVNEIVTFHRGYDLTKENMKKGQYPVVGSTSIIGYHNEYKIEGPGIVTGRSGSLGQYQLIWDNYWPHNTSLYISDFKNHSVFYIFSLLQTLNFSALNNGGAIPTLNRNTLSNIEVLEPPVSLQVKYSLIAKNIYSQINIKYRQIKMLRQARGCLLPKLMNGEVEV